MLTRIQSIIEDQLDSFKYDLEMEADTNDSTELPMETIWSLWKQLMLPQLDEELNEFVEMYALRCSDSLKKVKFQELLEIFDEDFTIGSSQHDDPVAFDEGKQDGDDEKLLQEVTK